MRGREYCILISDDATPCINVRRIYNCLSVEIPSAPPCIQNRPAPLFLHRPDQPGHLELLNMKLLLLTSGHLLPVAAIHSQSKGLIPRA
jgi:hypothetical protein